MKFEEQFLKKKCYIVKQDIDTKKFELVEVEVVHVWWKTPALLMCQLSDGLRLCYQYVAINKKFYSQEFLGQMHFLQLIDRRNYYIKLR